MFANTMTSRRRVRAWRRKLTCLVHEDERAQVDAVAGACADLLAEHVLQLLRHLVLATEHVHRRGVGGAPAVDERRLTLDLDKPVVVGVDSGDVTCVVEAQEV